MKFSSKFYEIFFLITVYVEPFFNHSPIGNYVDDLVAISVPTDIGNLNCTLNRNQLSSWYVKPRCIFSIWKIFL